MEFIPYGRQHIDESDINAVIEVLRSDWLTQGPSITRFEDKLRHLCQCEYVFAVSNATAALHLACRALNIGKDDIVWTSPNTFLASANCALYCDAQVDFVDICPKTYNMSVEALEHKLITAAAQNKLPKVVIPVHFAGQSCDMRAIKQLAEQYHFKIIEDASHAVGGSYLGLPVGNCRYSDIAVFSFHPVKIITTGEGGSLMTNDPKIASKLGLLRTHGMTRDNALLQNTNEGAWYYEQLELGYNYRITDLQCALGVSQLDKLEVFLTKRHAIAKKYDALLENVPVIIPYQSTDTSSALHLYPIQVHDETKRKSVFDYLRKQNIGVNVHYIPVYLQPYYQQMGFKKGYCPVAENYYARAISLPMHPDLTDSQLSYIEEKIREALI